MVYGFRFIHFAVIPSPLVPASSPPSLPFPVSLPARAYSAASCVPALLRGMTKAFCSTSPYLFPRPISPLSLSLSRLPRQVYYNVPRMPPCRRPRSVTGSPFSEQATDAFSSEQRRCGSLPLPSPLRLDPRLRSLTSVFSSAAPGRNRRSIVRTCPSPLSPSRRTGCCIQSEREIAHYR